MPSDVCGWTDYERERLQEDFEMIKRFIGWFSGYKHEVADLKRLIVEREIEFGEKLRVANDEICKLNSSLVEKANEIENLEVKVKEHIHEVFALRMQIEGKRNQIIDLNAQLKSIQPKKNGRKKKYTEDMVLSCLDNEYSSCTSAKSLAEICTRKYGMSSSTRLRLITSLIQRKVILRNGKGWYCVRLNHLT